MKNSSGSDYLWTASKKGVTILSGLAVSVIVARFLGPELRGMYAYLLSLAAIGVVALNFGVNLSYQSARRREGREINRVFLRYSSALLIVLGAVGTGVLFLGNDQSLWALAILMTGASLFRMQVGHYALIDDLRSSSAASICGHILELVLFLGLIFSFPASLHVIVAGFLAKEIILGILFVRVLAKGGGRGSLGDLFRRDDKGLGGSLFHAGLMPYVLTVLIVVNYKIDIVILQHLGVPAGAIGVFAIGVLVAEYLWVVTDVFKDVQTSRSAKRDAEDDVARSLRAAVFFTLVVYIAFLAAGSHLIVFMFGGEFEDSYNVAVLMLLATFFMIFCKIIGTYYISTGNIRVYLRAMLTAVIANCSLNYLLIPTFGIYGAVFGSIVSYAIAGIWLMRDYCGHYGVAVRDVLIIRREDFEAFLRRR